MLLLTRRPGEKLMIGDEIEVVVIAVQGGQVRLGIKASEDVPIYREEIFNRIKAEQAQA